MTEDEAADVLALVAGVTPTDIYGTAWSKVLADVNPQALTVTRSPTISIPEGIPSVK